MTSSIPPVVRVAERLLVDIEQAVAGWARRHRYAHGIRLRDQAMAVALLAQRAWRNREQQRTLVRQLVDEIDTLKLCLQLGSRVRAFASFGQFEALARVAHDLGRQAGGWHKSLKGQNAASDAAAQRAQILSTRAASAEANA